MHLGQQSSPASAPSRPHPFRSLLATTLATWGKTEWKLQWLWATVFLSVLAYGIFQQFDIQWSEAGGSDWVAYWSVPHNLLQGKGFFDFEAMGVIQKAAGYTQPYYYPVMRLWNLPPLVTLLLPFGGLNVTFAALLWMGLSSGVYLIAALLYNRTLQQPLPQAVALALAILFLPFLIVLRYGQLSSIFAAFLIFGWALQRKGHHTAAGVILVPLLFKPHLVTVSLGLILWVALRLRAWRFFLAFGGMVLALTVVAFLLEPAWLAGWQKQGPPLAWLSVSLWDVAQMATGFPIWFQFTGVILLGGWTLWRHRHAKTITPHILAEVSLLSILAAPYGYNFDTVVILPTMIYIGSKLWHWQQNSRLLLVPLVLLSAWLLSDLSSQSQYYSYLVIVVTLWILTTHLPMERQPIARSGQLVHDQV